MDGRVGKLSVERVRYVINNLLHLVIVKYIAYFTLLRVIGRMKRAPHWGVLSRYLVIYICYSTGRSDIRDIFPEL